MLQEVLMCRKYNHKMFVYILGYMESNILRMYYDDMKYMCYDKVLGMIPKSYWFSGLKERESEMHIA